MIWLIILAMVAASVVMGRLILEVKTGRRRILELENAMADELANADVQYDVLDEEIAALKSDLADAHICIETVVAHEMKEVDRVHSVLEMVLTGSPNDAG